MPTVLNFDQFLNEQLENDFFSDPTVKQLADLGMIDKLEYLERNLDSEIKRIETMLNVTLTMIFDSRKEYGYDDKPIHFLYRVQYENRQSIRGLELAIGILEETEDYGFCFLNEGEVCEISLYSEEEMDSFTILQDQGKFPWKPIDLLTKAVYEEALEWCKKNEIKMYGTGQ